MSPIAGLHHGKPYGYMHGSNGIAAVIVILEPESLTSAAPDVLAFCAEAAYQIALSQEAPGAEPDLPQAPDNAIVFDPWSRRV